MSLTNEGFAIRRNNSCLLSLEVDCGQTRAPFHACCPTGFGCPPQYNVACCAPGTNCTDALIAAPQPQCSNATWDLFNNGGYFCCEPGSKAYDRAASNVCAKDGEGVKSGDRELTAVRKGINPATFVPSSSRASSQTLTPVSLPVSTTATVTSASIPLASATAAAPDSSSSSPPVGAIAGGVVGGVAALLIIAVLTWFLIRRRRQNNAVPELYSEPYVQQGYVQDVKYMHQADGRALHEVDGGSLGAQARELPAQTRPVELPGDEGTRKP